MSLIAVPALAAVAGIYFLRGSAFSRLTATSLYDVAWSGRVEAWRASFELFGRFPVLGTGLGTFIEAFPLVQPEMLISSTWDHAHNGPIELLVTGGVLGVAIALVGLSFVVARLIRVLREGIQTEHRIAGLAALGALTAAGFHELLDFGLLLPANAYTLTILVGAASASRLNADLRGPRRPRQRVDPAGLRPPVGEARQ